MKGKLRKKQIIECSKKIFAAKGGYYEVHIEDVIKEAKIGKGTFYQYFKNKEELFISLLGNFLDEWEEYVVDGTAESQYDDYLVYLQIFIEKSFKFFQQNEYLCNIYLCNGPGLNPVFEPFINNFEDRMVNYVLQALKESAKSGSVRKNLDLVLVANLFLGAFLRLAYYYFVLNRKDYTPKELKKLADNFFNIAMEGISCKK
jgi:AcrR family transcriptional regulator